MTTQSVARHGATLKDVAKIAGVSTATIARVIHNNGYVAPETRRAVEAAITQTGYQINAVAQGLRRQRTLLLGHILQSIAPNPFFATVALGVQQEAAARGCGVLVYNTQGDPDAERSAVETLLRQRVEAILLTTVTDEANVRLAVASGVPVVQVERIGTVPTHAVSVDNRTGASEAVAHLIARGHRRIAFIGLDWTVGFDGVTDPAASGVSERRAIDRERFDGYRDTMQRHHLPIDDALLDLGDTYYSPERGRQVTARLLTLPLDRRPTAIFAACDLLAAGVLQELQAQRIRVPDDLSVVGFDDTVASHLAPPLTSVAQPMLALGRTAAKLALEAVERGGPQAELRRERLATRLVVRASTAPPPS